MSKCKGLEAGITSHVLGTNRRAGRSDWNPVNKEKWIQKNGQKAVVKAPRSQCRGPRFDRWSGN